MKLELRNLFGTRKVILNEREAKKFIKEKNEIKMAGEEAILKYYKNGFPSLVKDAMMVTFAFVLLYGIYQWL